jgi:hypothetical protein
MGERDKYPSSVALLLTPCECAVGILPFCTRGTAQWRVQVRDSCGGFRFWRRSGGCRLVLLLGLVGVCLVVVPFLRVLR